MAWVHPIEAAVGRTWAWALRGARGPEARPALVLGWTADGRAVEVSDETLVRHGLIVGATGAGKTSLMLHVALQAIARGDGLLLIDAKADLGLLGELCRMAALAGRAADLRVIAPSMPELTHTWNVCEVGTETEITSKLILLQPFSEPGVSFREAQHSVLLAVVAGLRALGRAFHLGDVVACLLIPESIQELQQALARQGTPAARAALAGLAFALESFSRGRGEDGRPVIDWGQYTYWVSSIGRILWRYLVGPRGRIALAHRGDVSFLRAIREGHIVYVQLPILQEPESAWDWAKVVMMDLMTAVGAVNARGLRPDRPFLVLADEFAYYATGAFRALFEQARAARVGVLAAVQSYGQLKRDPKAAQGDMLQTLEDNTAVKVILRVGSALSLRETVEVLGKARRAGVRSERVGRGVRGERDLQVTLEEDYRVRPEELEDLAVGEAWAQVRHAGDRPPETARIRWPYWPAALPGRPEAFLEVLRAAAPAGLARPPRPEETAGFWERYERRVRRAGAS